MQTPEPGADRLALLIAESRTLDRTRDAGRLRQIFAEAALLTDRAAQPQKWAAFRSLFAQLSENLDPSSALTAYRDALTIWDREATHDSWAVCNLGIGWILGQQSPAGTPESEEAIQRLEAAVADYPYVAHTLAALYRFRVRGDALENWRAQVKYLELAKSQISLAEDPAGWASVMNELGECWTSEPGSVDAYDAGMKKRIEYQTASLKAVQDAPEETPAAATRIETYISLSEAYQFSIGNGGPEMRRQAEEFARKAVGSCTARTPTELRIRALLCLARAIADSEGLEPEPRAMECLRICDEAARLVDPAQTVMAANIDKFRALSYLKLIELGRTQYAGALASSAESCFARLDPSIYARMRRSIMQIAADGLVACERYEQAAECLRRAVEAGESALAEAASRASRLERIFDLRDSWALLAYCHLQANQIPEGIEALDRGKSRVWRSDAPAASFASMQTLIPAGGALLFPVFAPAAGAVAILSEDGMTVASLPDFGRRALATIVTGDPAEQQLGGWMKAYAFRNSQSAEWLDRIDRIGATLQDRLWDPVLAALSGLGIERGAELVWFPQGGTGILPLHGAWKAVDGGRHWIIDDFAVRYAPSVRALLTARSRVGRPAGDPLLVANPRGDLRYSAIEMAWAQDALGGQRTVLLEGAAATEQAVLAALPNASLAHFSTHAAFSLASPFESRLALAADATLKLDDLLGVLKESPPAAVILSACETAMTRVTGIVDEMLGFPAAFLENGTQTVLATLWPVADSAASSLIGRYYAERRANQTPAQALRAAQNWLRAATAGQLRATLKEMTRLPGSAGEQALAARTELAAFEPGARIFEHPFFWAAFTISGS